MTPLKSLVAALIATLYVANAHAATISGPSTSTTGTFTLTWPSGYTLRAINGSWQFANPPTTSYAFTNLPSGEYVFGLWTCWIESEPGTPNRTLCAFDGTSTKTVLVTRDAEVAVDTTTTAAGSIPYTADVSTRGSARIDVPVRTLPGVNGLAPNLSLSYDSARKGDIADFYRADDTLGYGWNLNGASVLTRCRGGLTGASEPSLTSTDRLCLDGQPLLPVSGSYWGLNTEYRTEQQSYIKVIGKNAGGAVGAWFEVRYPDGRVASYGDTTDSQALASGKFSTQVTSGWLGPNPVYLWAVRQVTDGFGNSMTYAYDRFDPYGMVQLKSISYGGATVELKYGPRGDLGNVSMGAIWGYVWRHAYLHTIRVVMNGTKVREYRLDSNLVNGHVRLEQIQECGYDTTGTTATCLKPLTVGWSTVSGGASPISLTAFTDGLGAITEFAYTEITTTSNPSTYSEAPFGSTIAVSGTGPRAIAVATEMKRSDGLTIAGRRQMNFAYKGLAYASTSNRGFVGFYEVRARDAQSSITTYTQTRLDFPFAGAVSQVRSFTDYFSTGTELARAEHAFAVKSQTSNVKYVYPLRSTQWVFEGTATVGGSEAVFTPCFRILSGDTCPGSGTEYETVSQMASTTTVGNTIDNPSFTPAFWGDVPDRTVSNVELTTTRTVNFQNTTTPWVVAAPIKTVVTDTATGEASRTVTNTFTYKSGTRELLTAHRLPGDPSLALLMTRTFTGNNLTSETLSGAGISARTMSYGPTYIENRYPASISNALSHTTNLDYDLRFGAASEITDPDGNLTVVEYDAFGRIERSTAQDGTQTTITYERCDLADCSAVMGAVAALKVTTQVSNGATQVAPIRTRYHDVLGRTVLSEVEALSSSNGWHRQRTVFDTRGRVQYVSKPYFSTQSTPTCSGASVNCTYFTYDVRDRLTREDRPDLGFTTTGFAGAAGVVTVTVTETVKTPGGSDVTRAKQSSFNVLGQLMQTIDAYGTGSAVTTTYDYTSHGDLDTVLVNGVSMASMTYNLARHRTQIVEPNSGTTTIVPDSLGQLVLVTDALGQETRYTFDLLGRLEERIDRYGTGSAVTNTWSWDALYGTGQLASRTTDGFTETYTYRAADSKLESIATDINVMLVHSGTYTRTLGYDSAGRLASFTYPSGSTFTTAFNSRGYATQLKSGTTVLEDTQGADAFGSATVSSFASGLKTIRGYDPATGRPTSIQTGPTATPKSIQDLEVQWRSNSTVYKRIDKRNTTSTSDDYTDTFSYDALERLTAQITTVGASRTLNFSYDSYGNLTSKTSTIGGDLNATGFSYGVSGKPHRLTSVTIGGIANTLSYDANGNTTTYDAASGNDTFLSHDGQNNVTKITVGTSAGTSTPTARDEFWYDPDGQRFLGRESWDAAGVQRQARTVYLGAFEEVIPAASSTFNLVQRTDLSAGVRHIRTRTTAGVVATRFEYVHRDHLGSVDVVTNASGTMLNNKTSFDPFGGRRAKNWATDISATDLTAVLTNEDERWARGFTEHEMLNRTGFIHMNGRVYDPRIGRFVSPDPIVQSPTFSQSYNRYSYVFDNSLSYSPTGYDFAVDPSAKLLSDRTAP